MSDPDRIVGAVEELSERDRAVLAMAKRRFVVAGAREAAVRDELGLTDTRYCQLLDAVIRQPAALAAEPVLVKRLLRLKQTRQTRRHRARTLAQSR